MASDAWRKRNAKARKLGYKNYYDYRQHGYGERPPGEPVQPPERRQRAGARGPAAFRRALRQPDKVALIIEAPGSRRRSGTYKDYRYIVTYTDGRIVEYRLPVVFGQYGDIEDWDDWLDYWHDLIDDADVEVLYYGDAAAAVQAA